VHAEVTGPQTIEVTASGADITAGNDIIVQGVNYNVSADASATDVGFTAVENTTEFSFSASEGINGTDIEADAITDDGSPDGEVGSTQTGSILVENTSSAKTSNHLFGGAEVDLNITSTPSGASVSNADNLNTTSVTTASDGTADFNLTLGDSVGTYEVTASLASNDSVNQTLSFDATAGGAEALNVTKVEDAFVTGASSADADQKTSVFQVRVEDAGGNLVTSQDVGVQLGLTGDATISEQGSTTVVSYGLADDGTPAGDTLTGSSGPFSYVAADDGDANEGQAGEFYVFITDSTAEDVDLTVIDDNGNVDSDSASATFYNEPSTVSVSTNVSDVNIGGSVAATATLQDSNGDTITVPDSVVSFSSDSSSVLSRDSSTTVSTDANGEVVKNFTAQSEGTAQVQVVSFNSRTASSDEVTVNGLSISDVTLDPSTVTGNQTVAHDLTYTVNSASNDGNSDTYTVTLPNTTSFEGVNSLNVTDANGDEISISSSASLADANGGTDNQVTFGIQPDSTFQTSTVTVDANVSVNFPAVDSVTEGDVTLDVSDSNNGNADATTGITIEPETAPPTATVTFDDQTVQNGSSTVTVASANLSEGGFVVIHAEDNGSAGAVLGNSSYLANGTTEDIQIDLSQNITANTTLVAMAHQDTDGDEVYEFDGGSLDGPYTEDGAPVTDAASITIEQAPEGPGDITGNGEPAQDLNGDGLFEDLNGDGELTLSDVQALFAAQDDIENTDSVDFNGDGSFTISDVQALFVQVQ
jgi:hypothetical protein